MGQGLKVCPKVGQGLKVFLARAVTAGGKEAPGPLCQKAVERRRCLLEPACEKVASTPTSAGIGQPGKSFCWNRPFVLLQPANVLLLQQGVSLRQSTATAVFWLEPLMCFAGTIFPFCYYR